MKNKFFYSVVAVISWIGLSHSIVHAQMRYLHGDDREYRIGMHSGNQFRTTFFNDGTWGGLTGGAGMSIVKADIAGEWPINSGHFYLIDGDTFVLSEVADNYDPLEHYFLADSGKVGRVHHIQSTVKAAPGGGTVGDQDPNTKKWWTFLPLPGFANPRDQIIAMAKGDQQWYDDAKNAGSWPLFWPDIRDPQNPYKIYSADGWAGSWNGYFGRNKFNADEESYFVADDYAKQKFPAFRPDTTDVLRGGLGIRMYVRGFQWAKMPVQDALFIVSDLENIGTYQHNKVVFGYKIGNNMGQTIGGGDAGDDGGSYSIADNLSWTWDQGGLGASDWGPTPVGISGAALLETPGNPFDGIDNDNDGNPNSSNYGMKNKEVGSVMLNTANGPKQFYAGSGPTISSSIFNPKVLGLNDQIVLIDYKDPRYKRTITTFKQALLDQGKTLDTDTLLIPFGGLTYQFWVGDTLKEIGDNLFDDNLNGIIDENRGVANPTTSVVTYLYLDHKYINYLDPNPATNGSLNPLIDERRDDGIDNNDNWDAAKDDVGQDGLGPTDLGYPGPDIGENDGKPTPGEPHFDKTDINESDMVGLTSFNLYLWSAQDQFGDGTQQDDEGFWKRLAPGSFYANSGASNVELLFGSGYFPLPPGDLERISYAFIVVSGPAGGWTGGSGEVAPPDNLLLEKTNVQLAYDQNYNFAKAPFIPTVTAVTGDKRVTLFWDNIAESSVDANNVVNFEGYKIYRSTDPGWNDMTPITDGHGSVVMRQPLAQYDLDDAYSGYVSATANTGVRYWLGSNTGLRHFYIDTTVTNGTTYYYAVTSYNYGDVGIGIDPAECVKYVAVQSSGDVEKGKNVAVVRPEEPAAGFVAANFKDSKITALSGSTSTGVVDYKILDGTRIKNNHTYRITFKDTVTGVAKGLAKSTKSFTLADITVIDTPKILIKDNQFTGDNGGLPVTDGFQLSFSSNPEKLSYDSVSSGWSKSGIPAFEMNPFAVVNMPVALVAGNFKIIFNDVGVSTSKRFKRGSTLLPAIPVNFKIYNTTTNKEVDFAFYELDTTFGPGKFTINLARQKSDEIIFLNDGDSIASWQVDFIHPSQSPLGSSMPGTGDSLILILNKPFLSNDTLLFTTLGPSVDNALAKADMGKIKVVPNPYIVTNSWEPHNPYSSGRGERQLHFIHLPAKCTIKIFNVRGQLVNSIEHDSPLNDGTEIWNMLSKDNLEISYGIYIYHVQAAGVGEKIGKFVVLK